MRAGFARDGLEQTDRKSGKRGYKRLPPVFRPACRSSFLSDLLSFHLQPSIPNTLPKIRKHDFSRHFQHGRLAYTDPRSVSPQVSSDGYSETDGMEENYQFINECSEYNDNILILVECRKKSEDEMRSTGPFENKSDHYYQAILIDKNFDDDQIIFRARENKINTPESVLRVLFDWSCKEVAKKIDSEPGASNM